MRLNTLIVAAVSLWIGGAKLYAQSGTDRETWTLQSCVGQALEYQFSVRQAANNVKAAESDRLANFGGFLPSVNAGAGNFWNSGLSIDPVTNEVNRNNLSTASGSLSAQWTVFDGFQTWNAYRQSQVQVALAAAQLDDAQNTVALNTASQFLAVLLADESLRIAEEQLTTTSRQKERSAKLLAAGAIPPNEFLSVEAQWAADAQRVVAAENQYQLAQLALKQLMGLSASTDLTLQRPGYLPTAPSAVMALDPEAIFTASVAKQPSVRAAEHQLMASHYAVARAQGARVPTLSVTGQLSTSYSDRALKYLGTNPQVLPVGFWLDGADQVPVYTMVNTPSYGDFSFNDQLRENVRQFVGLNLSVPLFNGFRIQNSVQRAKLAESNAALQVAQQRDAYRQSVERAHADAAAAWKQYEASLATERSAEKAYFDAQARYDQGSLNIYDYTSIKNNYLAATSNRVRALYDSQFKNYVVEFYLNNPLNHE
ncbi:MAG: TolC family protein [Schleiferiaceae bacterium]